MVNKNLWESETKHWHYIFEREITAFNNHSCYLCHVLRGNVLPSTFLLPPLDLCLKRKPCDHICTNLKGGGYACSCYPCYTPSGGKCNLLQCKINGNCYPFSYVNSGNSCQVRNMCSPSNCNLVYHIIIIIKTIWLLDELMFFGQYLPKWHSSIDRTCDTHVNLHNWKRAL